ncbi:MAG: phospho-sugar mutase [Acidimicrobiia bacterium]
MSDLIDAARDWIAGDPDPTTRAELERQVDDSDLTALAMSMGAPLTFGTAGIRGEVGPGSSRMNRATVIRVTAGLADYMDRSERGSGPEPVVIGFDARPDSRTFAEDAAGVLAAAGLRVVFFPDVTPTPLVAFAAKILNAPAAIVVTASHNPPADNGYKVYGSNAAQIIQPVDTSISEAIERVGHAIDVQRVEDVFSGTSPLVTEIGPDLLDRYRAEVEEARPNPHGSDLRIVYTPIHGVGGRVLDQMFGYADHTGLIPVEQQFDPDGSFPTVAFPNPEEPGALDLALALARDRDADLVLANDPDADRLAAAVPSRDGWRMLSGNELGVLIGDYVLRYWDRDETPIVVNSVVSSPMLARIAKGYGAYHEVSLTGFKWIINAALALEAQDLGRFAFGYEEALGYSIGRTVRDKDGISAALVMADLAAELDGTRRGVMERLHELWRRVGLWVSAQHSIHRPGEGGGQDLSAAVGQLASAPPESVNGMPVVEVTDFRTGGESRPFWLGEQDLVELDLGEPGRILVRPSGTEPKLKIYVDLCGEVGADPDESHDRLVADAQRLAVAVGEGLGL